MDIKLFPDLRVLTLKYTRFFLQLCIITDYLFLYESEKDTLTPTTDVVCIHLKQLPQVIDQTFRISPVFLEINTH